MMFGFLRPGIPDTLNLVPSLLFYLQTKKYCAINIFVIPQSKCSWNTQQGPQRRIIAVLVELELKKFPFHRVKKNPWWYGKHSVNFCCQVWLNLYKVDRKGFALQKRWELLLSKFILMCISVLHNAFSKWCHILKISIWSPQKGIQYWNIETTQLTLGLSGLNTPLHP